MSRHDAGTCPVCGCGDMTYGERNIDNDSMTYDWTCPDCGSTGMEVYNILFVEHEVEHKGRKKAKARKVAHE